MPAQASLLAFSGATSEGHAHGRRRPKRLPDHRSPLGCLGMIDGVQFGGSTDHNTPTHRIGMQAELLQMVPVKGTTITQMMSNPIRRCFRTLTSARCAARTKLAGGPIFHQPQGGRYYLSDAAAMFTLAPTPHPLLRQFSFQRRNSSVADYFVYQHILWRDLMPLSKAIFVIAASLACASLPAFGQGSGGGGGGSGGGAGGGASAGGASTGGAATGSASGPTAGSPSSVGSPNAGAAGAGTSAVSGTPSGPGNPAGLNNSGNDPSGAGNASKVASPSGNNGLGVTNSQTSGRNNGQPVGTNAAGAATSTGTVGMAQGSAAPGGGSRGPTKVADPNGDAQIDAENRKLDRAMKNICRGC